MVTIQGREVDRVLIVDDEPAARDGYGYAVEDLDLDPVRVPGPVGNVGSFVADTRRTDAVICDYHLKQHSYAAYNGDELVAACYKAGIPGILCTTFTDVGVTIRRDCLRYIPALLKTNSPEPEAFVDGLRHCIEEMKQVFRPVRRPWRTLIRVAAVDEEGGFFHVVVPAWSPQKKIRLYNDSVPGEIRGSLEPGRRFHAEVNIGAGSDEELFFVSWESV